MIYLDHAATSWPKPEEVCRAADEWLRHMPGSPGRGAFGHAGAEMLFEAREEVAALFRVTDSSRVVFMLNATDGLNAALFGLPVGQRKILTSAMEHNAVARPLRYLASQGQGVERIPCDPQSGELDMEALWRRLQGGEAGLVVIQHASNVAGCLQPIQEIRRETERRGIPLIVDAAQTAGAWFYETGGTPGDHEVVCFSGHKGLLGPQGTGGMIVGKALELRPWRFGGTGSASEQDLQPGFLPDRLESGTPNTSGIAALQAAARFIQRRGAAKIVAHEERLIQGLIEGVREIPGLHVLGPTKGQRRIAVAAVAAPGLDSGRVAHRLYCEQGIACRGGLHCAPWAHQTLGTIDTGALRVSVGPDTTEAEVGYAVAAIRTVIKEELG